MGTALRAGVLCAAAAGVVVSCTTPGEQAGGQGVSGVVNDAGQSPSLREIPVPDEPRVPAVTFTDTSKRPFRLPDDLHAPLTVVFFGYTHCPSACPTALADLAQALRRIEDRALVHVVFITVDPERDTPSRIRRYLDRFDPGFTGLTGDPGSVTVVAQALGVPIGGTRRIVEPGSGAHGDDAGYQVSHGAQLVGLDAEHRRRVIWPEGTPVGDLEHDIATLVKEYR